MTTTTGDFDAAKAVADQLKGMEKARQQRVLRWVAESLGLDIASPPPAERRPLDTSIPAGGTPAPPRDLQHPPRQQGSQDIKTFVESKRPRSDVQFAAVVAYYYRFEVAAENRRDSIDVKALQDAARLAGRRRPPKPHATLNNAKNLGYLDSSERGQFRISSVGENLVAMTLPGSGRDRNRDKTNRKRKSHSARPTKR